MSYTTNGAFVRCDCPGCQNNTRLPVALTPTLTLTRLSSGPAIGWLFVSNGSNSRHYHYCPDCIAIGLAQLLIDEPTDRYISGLPKGI